MTEGTVSSAVVDDRVAGSNAYDLAVAARLAEPLKRPHGGGLLIGGGTALVLGLIALIVGLIMPTFSDPGRAGIGDLVAPILPTFNPWKWPLIYAGSSLCSIAVLVMSLGIVVRALFFLPGREVPTGEIHPLG
jgi:hypothetical protein